MLRSIDRHANPRSSVRFAVLLFFATLALAQNQAVAGELDPSLARELAEFAPDEEATAFLVLSDRLDTPAISRALSEQRASRQERHRRVIEALQDKARASQAQLLADLIPFEERGEISRVVPFWIDNVVLVRGTRSALESISARPDISLVAANKQVTPISPAEAKREAKGQGGVPAGLQAIRAPEVWRDFGINGAGALLANVDTGVDGTHPALSGSWRGNHGHLWSECWLDLLPPGTEYPWDSGGHGTLVMGVMAGIDPGTQDTVGVAWGAEWIAANFAAIGGGVFREGIMTAYQWLSDPDGDPSTVEDVPDVVENSWRESYGNCEDWYWAAIDNLEAAGTVVVFIAGNEGPNPSTIGHPSDRATTLVNAFSVGAVDANSLVWPYPIANWSSRGPSRCSGVPAENLIKPELVAPGVDVYTTDSGGGYTTSSGTSLAGPHVAGIVGLMRSADPDLEVETIKNYLLQSARDQGEEREDNTYGWGTVDAYEAVYRCLTEFGTLTGSVGNASDGDRPVPGATLELLENGRTFPSYVDGTYSGMSPLGTYTVRVTHPSFAEVVVPGVEIQSGINTRDFSLVDIAPPVITVEFLHWFTPDSPITIGARIQDYSGVQATVHWQVNGGAWREDPMIQIGPEQYEAVLPPQALGSGVGFYVRAVDVASLEAQSPPGAPWDLHRLYVVQPVFADDAESDQGWSLVAGGDAQQGRWARMDPWGTFYLGQPVEPAEDHTPDLGVQCFVTGAGSQGGTAGTSDVDAGCVTLTSPRIELSGYSSVIASYYRWFALFGPQDGAWTALASNDDGATWVPMESIPTNANAWSQATTVLTSLLPMTDAMRFRFVVCDTGSESLVEGALDDFMIGVGSSSGSSSVEAPLPATPAYLSTRPNPFVSATALEFSLPRSGDVQILVCDARGRRVRTLTLGRLEAGTHTAAWDGLDEENRPAGAGVYFLELRAGGTRVSRKAIRIE